MSLKIKRTQSETQTAEGGGNGGTPPSSGAPPVRIRPLIAPRAPSSAKNKAKVLLSVLDGKIEWEKMTAESRKAFEALFKDKEFLAQFGLTGKEKAFDPEQMKNLYDGISLMYKTAVGMFLRWPPGALQLLGYSDEQKNMLAAPTANLANKFAPAFLVKHQELLIWGTMFAGITQANFIQASAEAKKLMAARSQPHPAISRGPNAREVAERAATIIQRPNPAPADRPAPPLAVPFSIPTNGHDPADSLSEFGAAPEGLSLE